MLNVGCETKWGGHGEADRTFARNSASQRVFEKAGLELVEEVLTEGQQCRVFRKR